MLRDFGGAEEPLDVLELVADLPGQGAQGDCRRCGEDYGW